jgi:hypothetical protein
VNEVSFKVLASGPRSPLVINQANQFQWSEETPCYHATALNHTAVNKVVTLTALTTALRMITSVSDGYRGKSSQGVNLTTKLHLVTRLRMRGAIRPFPQYVFMAWYLIKHRIRLYGMVLS